MKRTRRTNALTRSRTATLAGLLAAALCVGCAPGEQAPDPQALDPQVVEGVDGVEGGAGSAPADPAQLARLGTEAAREIGLQRVLFGDFDAMRERRYLRALVVPSMTYYFLDGAVQRGATYEAFKLFEKWLNEELGTGVLKIHLVIVPVTRDELLPALIEGLGDIAASGITITPERQRSVDFGAPFMTDVREIVVTGPSAPAIASLDDLAGREIYVRRSSSYYESLLAVNESFREAGKTPITLTAAEQFLEDEDLLEMVDAGIVPMVVVDEHKAEFWNQILDNITLHPNIAVRTQGSIAWAFRKESPQLAGLMNRFVAGHKKGTLLGNIILNRYLKDTSRVRNVLVGEDRERYLQTVDFFRQYATQYGFNYLLMVAQGFQESRLDQSLVSSRGALGIMQLLPSTAADPAVGIPDIEHPEQNVHAGIRYMRWVRDTHFDDEAIDSLNRTLLSFAAYNAGPNRIARLRREAAERGLDPNRWFRNVELLAAERIGRETVEYVANIYKYYAAYRLLNERPARRSER